METVNNRSKKREGGNYSGGGRKFFYFLLALLLLRPSLDILSQKEIRIHPDLPDVNVNLIIGGVIFLITLLFLIKNIKLVWQIPLFWPIFLFLALSFVSIFYSLDIFTSFKEFIRIATIFFLYFSAYQLIKNEKDWHLLLGAILISFLLPAAFALFQLVFSMGLPDDFGGFDRIYGTFAHPNPFSFYTLFILGLLLCLVMAEKEKNGSWSIKNIYIYLSFFVFFLLFSTYTRSALAGLGIFLLIFGLFKYRKVLLAGLLVFSAAYLFSNVFRERLWELVAMDPYGSIVWRFRLWRDMLPVFFWQPFLGYGIGVFSHIVEFYRGFSWGSLEAHNDYFKILVENGIVGLLSYLWLVISAIYYLLKGVIKNVNYRKIFSLGLFAIATSLFLAGFFDNVLRTTALQWNFWILLAGWFKILRDRPG